MSRAELSVMPNIDSPFSSIGAIRATVALNTFPLQKTIIKLKSASLNEILALPRHWIPDWSNWQEGQPSWAAVAMAGKLAMICQDARSIREWPAQLGTTSSFVIQRRFPDQFGVFWPSVALIALAAYHWFQVPEASSTKMSFRGIRLYVVPG